MAEITAAEAAAELLRRDLAQESMVAFAQAVEIPGAPVPEDPDEWLQHPVGHGVTAHHQLIMEKSQKCIETDYGRLMIFAPPGSAKSTYASVVAPAWAMGKYPGLRCLMASYAATPIIRASKRVRQLVASDAYRSIWPDAPMIKAGENAADEWNMDTGSGLFVAGIMGGITSSRLDFGVLDDPVAGREEADSENARRKLRQEYEDSFLSRLKPNASIIIIMTRWHLDDLCGTILPENYDGESGPILCRDGMVWEVINLQAKCERRDDPVGRKIGEYLWPEWFGDRHWAIYENNPRTWSSLYQQRPTMDTGGQFEKDWFKRHDWKENTEEAPPDIAWYGSSDWAVTKKLISSNPDWTEHIVCGLEPGKEGMMYLHDGLGAQVTANKSAHTMLAFCRKYDPICWLSEKGVIKNAVEPILDRAMEDEETYVAMEFLPTTADKIAMVAAFRARAQAGKVSIRKGAWGDALIAQLCAFPFSPKDDKVDACGLLGRYVAKMYASKRDEPVAKKPVKPFSVQMAEMAFEEDDEQEERLRRFKG